MIIKKILNPSIRIFQHLNNTLMLHYSSGATSLARYLEKVSAMIIPGPAIGIVVTRSAPSIDIGSIPGVIDYRVIVVGISGIDYRRRRCVIVVRIVVRICWIPGVRVVGWIKTPAIRIPSGIQPIVIFMAAAIMITAMTIVTVMTTTIRCRFVTTSSITLDGSAYCN